MLLANSRKLVYVLFGLCSIRNLTTEFSAKTTLNVIQKQKKKNSIEKSKYYNIWQGGSSSKKNSQNVSVVIFLIFSQ